MPTVAEQVGETPHLSPLLRRLRRTGLSSVDDLRRLAVARGCWHYRNPQDDNHPTNRDPGGTPVTDVELAVGMLTAAQEFDPVLVRCAAQLLSGEEIPEAELVRLAILERAVPSLRHIARAGADLDTRHRERWQRLLNRLPETRDVPDGRLPHRSRFAVQSGVTRQGRQLRPSGHLGWLRPHSTATREKQSTPHS